MNKFVISLVLILTAGSAAAAEKITFCVVNDFMQIVTYRGDNEDCLEFETPLDIISGEQGPAGPAFRASRGLPGLRESRANRAKKDPRDLPVRPCR